MPPETEKKTNADPLSAWRRRPVRTVLADDRWAMACCDTGLPAEADPDATPTLLFVHGNPTWAFHWRRLVERFEGAARCVTVDHLGCGQSEKPARSFRLEDRIRHLMQVIDRLDLQRVTLVAQDWGGAIGLGALLRRRDRLERITLFNTGAFRPWFIPWRIRVCRTPLLGRLGLQGMNLFSRAAIRMTTGRKQLEPQIARAYLAPHDSWANRRAVYDFVQDIPLSESHPTWRTLGGIEDALPELAELPIRLVWGMKDWCFTPECLEKFLEAWPSAEATRLADAGHWVVEDAPEECAAAIENLLSAPTPSSSPAEGAAP